MNLTGEEETGGQRLGVAIAEPLSRGSTALFNDTFS
jgi:hypothetical protein